MMSLELNRINYIMKKSTVFNIHKKGYIIVKTGD